MKVVKKTPLLVRLILGLILGILIGMTNIEFLVRVMVTFNAIFGSLLEFSVPLIILAFISWGIAELGRSSTKILGLTVFISYLSSVLIGLVVLIINLNIFPTILSSSSIIDINQQNIELQPYFTMKITPMFSITAALVFSFILGIGVTKINHSTTKTVLSEFNSIIALFLNKIIIPLLPLHIAGIFANLSYSGQAIVILTSFIKVFACVLLFHMLALVCLYLIASIVSGKNPFRALKNMFPAYITALGTQSSAATIPVTVECMRKNDIKKEVAEFTSSLCATIHLPGSIVTISSCALAVMLITGSDPNFTKLAPFIMMLGVMMVAAPGIPGGAVVAALGILQSMLGFNEQMIGLMISLYVAQDSFGTACNVTGDGAIGLIINTISKKNNS